MKIGPLNLVNSGWGRARSSEISTEEYIRQLNSFSYLGNTYELNANQTMPGQTQEPIANNFAGYVQGAYKANGIVFACVLARMSLFSQARFQWRRLRDGKPQDLFGTGALAKLERPWPGGRTSNLLVRMLQDADLGGNSFTLDRGTPGLRRLRPDWTTIIIASDLEDMRDAAWDPDSEVVGYAYTPGGMASGNEPYVYRAEMVAHYAPIPDPEASFRGMSWLTPVIMEILGDKAANAHKLDYFERGGTPNMTIEYDPAVVDDIDKFERWKKAIEAQIAAFGPTNRRLHLGGGTKANVVGSNMEQLEFKVTQGAGETRIATAAGVPAVVLGISEGLEGSSLNAGNYAASMRRFSDMTMAFLWQAAADALDALVTTPRDAELAVDTRFIPALQADRTDAANIQNLESQTITGLRREGFTAESVKAAVINDDWSLLEHDGSPSVQTREPGPTETPAAQNGGGPAQNVPQPA